MPWKPNPTIPTRLQSDAYAEAKRLIIDAACLIAQVEGDKEIFDNACHWAWLELPVELRP